MRLIDADNLNQYCYRCADVSKHLHETVMDKIGHGESAESAIGAVAYFMQKEKMYRFEIPSVIDCYVKDNAQIIDVAPVVHGQWLNFAGDFQTAECDKCGELYDVVNGESSEKYFEAFKQFYKFCPNCGARMDGDAK